MQRIGITGTTVLIALLCGIGIFRIQEYPFQEMPTTFVQAQSDIIEMTYADHGKLLLTADSEGNVTFWNTASKKQVRQLSGVGYFVRANENGTLVLFSDWTQQTPVQKWPRVSHITLLRFPATNSPSSELQYDVEKWTTPGMIIDSLPDLSRLLTFGATNTLALIDTQHGKVLSLRSFSKDANGIRNTNFSWDGKYLLAPDLEHPSYVLNATDLSTFRTLPRLLRLTISNDNQYIAGISWDGGYQSWNIKTQKQITKKTLYSHCILIYPHDDNHFLIYGLTGDNKHWNDVSGIFAADGTFIQEKDKNVYQPIYNGQRWRIISYGFESGSAYYVGAKTPYVNVIDLSKNEIVHRLNTVTDVLGNERAWNGSGPNGMCKYAIASDGSQAAAVTPGNMIRFYDFNARNASQPALYHSNSNGNSIFQIDGRARDFIVLPKGGFAVCSTSGDYDSEGHVDLIDSSGKVQSYSPKIGNGIVETISISPDGDTLAGSSQWGMWLLDMKSGATRKTPITVSPEGKQYYSLYPASKPLWQSSQSTSPFEIGKKDVGKNPILRTDWGADGKATGTKTIFPFRMTRNGYHYWLNNVIPAPYGGKMLVYWVRVNSRNEKIKKIISLDQKNFSNGIMEIRNSFDGSFYRAINVPQRIKQGMTSPEIAWSQNGKRVAIADGAGIVYIWDAESGKQIAYLSGISSQYHPKTIFSPEIPGGSTSMAFSPNNEQIAISRGDGAIYLYSLKSQLPAAQIGKATDGVRSLQFSADGKSLYGVTNHEVRSWKVPEIKS